MGLCTLCNSLYNNYSQLQKDAQAGSMDKELYYTYEIIGQFYSLFRDASHNHYVLLIEYDTPACLVALKGTHFIGGVLSNEK